MSGSEQLVLVTGGTGFLAANVIKLLLKEGYKVRTTVRDPSNQKKVEHLGKLCPQAKHPVDIVKADLNDTDSWPKAVAGCTFVHHVASPFPIQNPETEDELFKPAVEGTLNVLKACVASKTVKRVIVTSSTVAISDGSKSSYTEADWIDPKNNNLPFYNRSKALAERAAWKFVEELPDKDKFELTVVNPGFILGPVNSGTLGTSTEIINRLLNGAFPAVPKFSLPVCDVRDVAMAHLKCMTVPEAVGHRHIIYSDTLLYPEICSILDEEFRSQGYKPSIYTMPNFLCYILSIFIQELRDALFLLSQNKYDNSRMTQVLGITPIPCKKSILDMAYTMIQKGFARKTPEYRGPSKPLELE